MIDRVIGFAAIAVLAAFVGIPVGFVRVPDLAIIIALVVCMAGYDFYRSLLTSRGNRR